MGVLDPVGVLTPEVRPMSGTKPEDGTFLDDEDEPFLGSERKVAVKYIHFSPNPAIFISIS